MSSENQNPNQYPLGEPSVLDYVRSLFRSGNGDRIQIPGFLEDEQVSVQAQQFLTGTTEQDVVLAQPAAALSFRVSTPFPWRSLLALVLAIIGQRLFEPPPTTYPLGYAFYIASLSALAWAIWRGEWTLPAPAVSSEAGDPQTFRLIPLILSLFMAISAYFMFGDHLFTKANLFIWLLAVALFMWAFWLGRSSVRHTLANIWSFFRRDSWTINVSRWTLLLIAATALALFFRFYQTASVPPEPFSDHAEKLYDVYDVSQGETHIFFTRNTGREAIQMYWTLLVANVFGTGLSFMSLKLGTAILGFLTLPFMYLLGKEVGGRRVGLMAFVLTGIAYWPNVISRVGLRFPLYPLFVAPTLFFLLRGLRTGGHRATCAVLLGLTALCHVIPTIYAVGATIWTCMSGKSPPPASDRTVLEHLLFACLLENAHYDTAASVLANIPTGYRTKDTSLTQNMAVTLTGEKEGNDLLVEAADSSRSKYALGVVVNLSESLIALSSVSPGVFVTSTGPVEVYVSDLNGAPKTGDLLALSPLKGILVKSVDQSEYTFGSALENFATESSQPIEVTANDGKTLTANVALMKANVDVNPPLKSDPASDNDWLQSFATNLTGRELSSFRIIALILVFVTMMVIAGEVIFSVVSGSITAVGRNPLARKAIAGQALRSFVLAGLVLAAGVSIIFLLIWL